MLLALDTATSTASLALYDRENDRLLAEQTWRARRRQTEETLPVLQEMMARLGCPVEAVTAIAVTTGPGSFTGVRIGISMAKGMVFGLPSPPQLIGVPVLSVTAAPFVALAASAEAMICAVLQAGRDRYNWAWFGPDDLLRRPAAGEHNVGKLDSLVADLAATEGTIWLAGETTPTVEHAVAGLTQVRVIDAVSGLRRAGHLARLAALHLAAGHHDAVDTLQPLYLREPR